MELIKHSFLILLNFAMLSCGATDSSNNTRSLENDKSYLTKVSETEIDTIKKIFETFNPKDIKEIEIGNYTNVNN